MRKDILALGIILLLAGVIISSVAAQSNPETENKLVERKTDVALQEEVKWGKWQISANFNKSQRMLVDFQPPTGETIPDGEATYFINITDPNGGKTTFEFTYRRGTFSSTLNISVTSNDGGLTVENPPPQVGGVTQFEGLYMVDVYSWKNIIAQWYYPPNGELGYLELYVVNINRNYPYLIALPVGIASIAIGAVLSVWGARSTKKRILKPRERRS